MRPRRHRRAANSRSHAIGISRDRHANRANLDRLAATQVSHRNLLTGRTVEVRAVGNVDASAADAAVAAARVEPQAAARTAGPNVESQVPQD